MSVICVHILKQVFFLVTRADDTDILKAGQNSTAKPRLGHHPTFFLLATTEKNLSENIWRRPRGYYTHYQKNSYSTNFIDKEKQAPTEIRELSNHDKVVAKTMDENETIRELARRCYNFSAAILMPNGKLR